MCTVASPVNGESEWFLKGHSEAVVRVSMLLSWNVRLPKYVQQQVLQMVALLGTFSYIFLCISMSFLSFLWLFFFYSQLPISICLPSLLGFQYLFVSFFLFCIFMSSQVFFRLLMYFFGSFYAQFPTSICLPSLCPIFSPGKDEGQGVGGNLPNDWSLARALLFNKITKPAKISNKNGTFQRPILGKWE